MPTAMTFTSLTADVVAYLERGYPQDTTVKNQIPRLINLAERAINRRFKILGFIEVVQFTLVAGVNVYSKPDRWRRTVSMRYGSGPVETFNLLTEDGNILQTESGDNIVLEQSVPTDQNISNPLFTRAYEYARMFWPDQTQVAPPQFYSDYDYQHWLITPTPDINYPAEIVYSQLPPMLDQTNQTNWLTNWAPEALLYRTLYETEAFLKNDERMATWKAYYDEVCQGLQTEDLQRVPDRAAVRKED
jgi:hypothetical protein